MTRRFRWQKVHRPANGAYIVVSHIGRRHAVDGRRWEIEHTTRQGRTTLHYRETRRGRRRLVRYLSRT